MTHTFPTAEHLPSMMAGWHVHLEGLPQATAGQHVAWPWDHWNEMHEQYRRQLGEA